MGFPLTRKRSPYFERKKGMPLQSARHCMMAFATFSGVHGMPSCCARRSCASLMRFVNSLLSVAWLSSGLLVLWRVSLGIGGSG